MSNELDWDVAYKHLQEVRHQYTEIGMNGVFGLMISLNPLLTRYAQGERTQELYDEMMAVK